MSSKKLFKLVFEAYFTNKSCLVSFFTSSSTLDGMNTGNPSFLLIGFLGLDLLGDKFNLINPVDSLINLSLFGKVSILFTPLLIGLKIEYDFLFVGVLGITFSLS
ncbi:hypothetical protein QCA50_015948 [Cerrena zonata]|uniref:Uncharacterized protein n=1 Tax=Cerrena zonata TaxID=2478898 RepID=A0AAW0FTM3_9APHY